jgi:hypothetical protein
VIATNSVATCKKCWNNLAALNAPQFAHPDPQVWIFSFCSPILSGMDGAVLPEAWVVKCAKCRCTVTCVAIDPQREHTDPASRESRPNSAFVVTCSCCWSARRYSAEQISRGIPGPSTECAARRQRELAQNKSGGDKEQISRGTLLVAASLIAAIRLRNEEIKPSPSVYSKIADSITLAHMISQRLRS